MYDDEDEEEDEMEPEPQVKEESLEESCPEVKSTFVLSFTPTQIARAVMPWLKQKLEGPIEKVVLAKVSAELADHFSGWLKNRAWEFFEDILRRRFTEKDRYGNSKKETSLEEEIRTGMQAWLSETVNARGEKSDSYHDNNRRARSQWLISKVVEEFMGNEAAKMMADLKGDGERQMREAIAVLLAKNLTK